MKFTSNFLSLVAAVSFLLTSSAAPVLKRANPTDIQVLQFALTLEHLEDTFYKTFLAKFSAQDFEDAGYPDWVRGRIVQIGSHESNHVAFLTTALGNDSVAACTYDFSAVTDPVSFVATSEVLEGVGVTAYLGAAQFLTNPAFLTAAGSILTTEARHNAWLNSAVKKNSAWSGPMDVPQTPNEVFSLASAFITSCPSSNPPLPFTAFPPLTISESGSVATLTFNGSSTDGLFLALLSGLTTQFMPITNGQATLPAGLQGTVYAVVSKNGTAVSDPDTVAGPAILEFNFPSQASN